MVSTVHHPGSDDRAGGSNFLVRPDARASGWWDYAAGAGYAASCARDARQWTLSMEIPRIESREK